MDAILFWSGVVRECNRIDHTPPAAPAMRPGFNRGPTGSSRATAIAHIAMHDAFFRIAGFGGLPGGTPKTFYLTAPPAWGGGSTSAEIASCVSGAAATVLKTLYPHADFTGLIDAKVNELAASRGANAAAFDVGEAIGNAILALRAGDQAGNLPDAGYAASPAPYHHRPDPNAPTQGFLGVGYGGTDPFVAAGIAPLAPYPAPNTNGYKDDLKEVIAKGGTPDSNATTRTPDETTIGIYWAYDGVQKLGTPPRLYNQVLEAVATARGNTEAQNARLFGLANAAMGDSGIYAWRDKYLYDLWRPVVGIRENDTNTTGPSITSAIADVDVDPPCDPYWLPLGAPQTNVVGALSKTPPFPAYPSGHATFGAAAFEVARRFYAEVNAVAYDRKKVDDLEFTFVSDELDGVAVDSNGSVRTRINRRYKSLAAAMYENSISRIFLGVHWRFDGTSGKSVKTMLEATDRIGGVPLGREIAEAVFTNFKQP